jgi:hypothetical protein
MVMVYEVHHYHHSCSCDKDKPVTLLPQDLPPIFAELSGDCLRPDFGCRQFANATWLGDQLPPVLRAGTKPSLPKGY